MAKIFRFHPGAAQHITMQAAQQAGLPVNMPQIAQGVQALLAKLAEYGIGLSVDDQSPYFQSLMANYGPQGGQTQNVRQVMPQAQQAPIFTPPPQAPQFQQPRPVPAPFGQPTQQWPQQPQAQYPVQQQPLPQGSVIPGRPLPPLQPPPHMQQAGVQPIQPGPVPLQAPVMGSGLGDNATGMTDVPPAPSILE